jgi:hypothetical protein
MRRDVALDFMVVVMSDDDDDDDDLFSACAFYE